VGSPSATRSEANVLSSKASHLPQSPVQGETSSVARQKPSITAKGKTSIKAQARMKVGIEPNMMVRGQRIPMIEEENEIQDKSMEDDDNGSDPDSLEQSELR
jgi:hypothetical protein